MHKKTSRKLFFELRDVSFLVKSYERELLRKLLESEDYEENNRHNGEDTLSLEDAVNAGHIRYVPFPEKLKGKYQAFTQADLTNLRKGGCNVPMRSVEEGTAHYVDFL